MKSSKIICLITLLILTGCNKKAEKFERKMQENIVRNKELKLSNYNDFEWDAIIILGPYSNVNNVAIKNRINLSSIDKSIEKMDDINLLIFLKNKRAVKTFDLQRNYGDFDTLYEKIILKNKANFYLEDNASSNEHQRFIMK